MRRRWGAVIGAMVLVLAGCSRFGSEDTTAATTATTDPFAVLASTSTTAAPTTTTTAPEPSTTATPTSATTATTEPSSRVVRDGIENRSTVEVDGWRIELTVGERETHRVDERVLLEARLTNLTDRTRHHELDQPDLMVIVDLADPERRAWSTAECDPTRDVDEGIGGLRAVEPGDDVPFVTEYPLGCELPAGTYAVAARIAVCPDDARIETANPGTFRCAEGAVTFLESGLAPLRLVD